MIERSLCAEYDMSEDCLFFDPVIKAAPAWTGFEFMAQAISALSGIRDRVNGEEPKLGFIMSVSSMRIRLASFKAGTCLEVKVRECSAMDLVYTFQGEVSIEGRIIMEGRLTVMNASYEQVRMLKGI